MATHLRLFSTESINSQEKIFGQLFIAVGASYARNIVKSVGESNEWERWNNDEGLEPITPNLSVVNADDITIIEGIANAEDLPKLYSAKEREHIEFDLDDDDFSLKLSDSLCSSIPEEIRDDFLGNSIRYYVGPHDIFIPGDDDDSKFIARPEFSIDIWDIGDTYNREEYLNLALKNKDFQKFITKLEAICGRVKACIYWAPH